MAGKKTGKRLLTWVLVLVMALSLLPLNALATDGPEAGGGSGMNFDKRADSNDDGTYTITMTAQATGTTTTTSKAVPMDIVLVLDQSGSMKENFGSGTRQSAMKEAVNSFIGEVAAKYSTEADHHMAIVTFGSDAETLKDWTAVNSTGETELTDKISGLPKEPSGATNIGAGMELAQTLMNSSEAGADRLKTVIVFTDGVPTTSSDFDTGVANNAISAAKAMKDDDVTIYTVGIFNGANTKQLYGKNKTIIFGIDLGECSGEKNDYWQYRKGVFSGGDIEEADIAAGNRFLNYLSSNYDASSIGVSRSEFISIGAYYYRFDITDDPAKGSDQGYYKKASDASSLKNIFKVISDIVPAPGDPALNKDTVITDTLSNYFTFATGTVDGDVMVYAGQRELINGKDITVNLNPTTKTVTVTGYDFSAHYTNSNDPQELVIEIKVKPSGKGYNEEKIPTNADKKDGTHAAKVEVKSEDGTEPTFVTSHETAKVTGHKVIYELAGGEGDMTGNGLYYPQGAAVPVTNSKPTLEDHEFTGWEITAPKDGETTLQNGKFTMPAADVTLTAQWREIEAPEPSKEDIKELLDDNAVQIICTNDESGHGSKTFGLIDDTFSIVHSGYNCEVKIDSFNEYVEKFNTELDVAQGTHISDASKTSKEQSIINLKWKDGAWTAVDAPAKHHVLCVTPKYTVTYTDGVDGEEVFADQVHNDLLSGTATPAFNGGKPTRNGYVFAGWNPAVARTVTGNATYVAQWTARTDLSYTVHYYLKNTTKKVADDKTVDGQTFNADVTENAIRISGYRVYGDSEKSITIGTGTNEIIFYYTRASRPSTPSKPTLNTGDHYAYVMGYPDGTVRPNGSITRAEVSAILFRLLSDKTRDEYFTTASSFTDVKAGAWYNNSIATLEKAGVIVDTAKGGAFRPNEAITRAELAAMLAQFSDAKPVKGVKFSDVSAEHWAYEAIAIAAKMGWIEGYPDGTFRPDATITRAEMMTLVNRALERVPSDEDHLLSKRVMLTFPDCKSGDWFYIAVQEATNSHTYERAATEKNGDEQWTALRANRDWTLLEK